MRIVCIIGAIVTTLLVGQDLLNINADYWFDLGDDKTAITAFKSLLVVLYFGVFAFYLYKRGYIMVLVLWCMMCLIYSWQFYKLRTFNWYDSTYTETTDLITFLYNIGAAGSGLAALGILVSDARKRTALAIFALISILLVIINVKGWYPYDSYMYIKVIAVTSPLLIAINYLLELKNYKPDGFSPTRKRTEHLALDEIE
jgi:hypothetical protein